MKCKFFCRYLMLEFLIFAYFFSFKTRSEFAWNKKQCWFFSSLLVFRCARCVRVRQKLVPRHLSATHDLALPIHLRICGESVRGEGSSQLTPFFSGMAL